MKSIGGKKIEKKASLSLIYQWKLEETYSTLFVNRLAVAKLSSEFLEKTIRPM